LDEHNQELVVRLRAKEDFIVPLLLELERNEYVEFHSCGAGDGRYKALLQSSAAAAASEAPSVSSNSSPLPPRKGKQQKGHKGEKGSQRKPKSRHNST
jgi:hypothetical protein